jgi:menaquinone-specific isochorismate synthase
VKLILNGKTYVYERLIFPTDHSNVLKWLDEQLLYPKVYWEGRGGKRVFAGSGASLSIRGVPSFHPQNSSPVRLYGGISFSAQALRTPLWNSFPDCYFFLPAIEIEQSEEEGTRLIFNQIDEKASPPSSTLSHTAFQSLPPILKRRDWPHRIEWDKRVSNYLKMIENRELEKIVLSRKTTLFFKERLSPLGLLHQIKKRSQHNTLFSFQMNPESAFIGATPEQLYERRGRELFSDVMAGTRPKGNHPQEEEMHRHELLKSDKERREFDYVKKFIHSALTPHCTSLETDGEDRLFTTTNLIHLYNRFVGRLKEQTSDSDLLKALHPTPSLAGTPQKRALSLLEEKEPRGWYAGPIGWISALEAHLSVGIRSALVQREKLHLFSGAGIVQGSESLREWEELEDKIAPFKRIFL